MLGPDILAPELDEQAFLRRLRADDPTRPIGDALLDQRTIAGHRQPVEVRGLLRRAGSTRGGRPATVSDDEALRDRPLQRARGCSSPRWTGCRTCTASSTRKAGRPCPRCGDADPQPRPGRRQPADLLVRGMPVVSARNGREPAHAPRRAQGRGPHRARQHVRLLRRGARARRRHDRVRRAARAPRRHRRAAARPRLRGRRRAPRRTRSRRASRTSPAPSTTASSSTSTSRPTATRSASSRRCASTA